MKNTTIAQKFLETCTTNDTRVLVPEHFLYELINVYQRLAIEVSSALKLFGAMKESILTVVTPDNDMWLLAEKIASEGHQKSGFPSMYNSIYHALAIESKGFFVTADRRHFTKAEKFSHIRLLSGWENIFHADQ
jgi:predicted nucleic acid-binding protein